MRTDSTWSPQPSLQSTLAEIAERLTEPLPRTAASRDEQILERLTVAAVTSVPGADYAGLTMRENGELVSRAPSHPQISDVDQLQVSFGEGPCVDAVTPGTSVRVIVEDFADESRWPQFAPAAAGHGIRSLLSFTMAPSEAPPGALNLYSTRPHAFDAESQAVGATFALQAAIAIYGAETIAGLERALQTRDVIGRAKGILMERFRLDDQQAFDLLVRSSQETNTKLVEVAKWLSAETATRGGPGPKGSAA